MPKFIVTSLGCKVNQYDSAAVAETLRLAGLDEHDGVGPVDLVVVHTCCVTATAAGKCRRHIRRLAAAHPGAHLAVTGCYATSHSSRLQQIPGVTTVVGHHDDMAACFARLAGELVPNADAVVNPPQGRAGVGRHESTATSNTTPTAPSTSTIRPFFPGKVKEFRASGAANLAPLSHFKGRHRAIVKVQDGCDAFCAYCIVPQVRRRVFSRPVETVLAEVGRLVDAGHREVVLCGVCLGAYGRTTTRRDRGSADDSLLAHLVAKVADVDGLKRVRLSSLDPADVTDRLLSVMAEKPNLCPHLHLPLQSGSSDILRRMNRQYDAADYAAAVDSARTRLDLPAITTDVIVGFPGETDEDFAATLAMARHAGFAKIHIFPFSPREGTEAAKWTKDSPPADVVKRRCAELDELQRDLATAYRAQFVGRTVEVLLEKPASGLTARYVRVVVRGLGGRAGAVEDVADTAWVRITGQARDGLVGHVVRPT